MKSVLLSLCLMLSGVVLTQTALPIIEPDTLRLGHYSGGPMDSIDVGFTYHSSTLPGGGMNRLENTRPIDFLLTQPGAARFYQVPAWKKARFSALPHLGFGYVFGTQGAQYVHAEYQQSFGTKNLLNIDYDLQKSNGFLRNSASTHHNVQLQFWRKSAFYSFALRGQYLSRDIGQSDGVESDEFIDQFGLSLLPVRKPNAQSRYRGMEVGIAHYFDFLMTDSLNALGIYVENKMRVLNRKYWEFSDTLSQLYNLVQIDNDSTMDQNQLSEAINGAGVFFQRKQSFFKAGIQSNYWRYFNLGNELSRTEVNIDGEVRLALGPVDFYNHTNFNLLGANQEWYSNFNLKTEFRAFEVLGQVSLSSLLPEQFQRFYYGNHIFTYIPSDNWQKQTNLNVKGEIGYQTGRTRIAAFGQLTGLKDNYFFDSTDWRNDVVGDLLFTSLGLKLKTHYKILQVSLRGSYNSGDYVPDFIAQGRIALQGRLFKTKRLLGQLGVEASYYTAYETAAYLPMLDVFILNNPAGISPAAANLHAYGGFEIDQFRFFFRVENIGYAWNDSRNKIAENYPIPSMQIRIGITWDFFN